MYLGSTISDSLFLDSELNKRIGKAATTFSRLTKRVWPNKKLTKDTKSLRRERTSVGQRVLDSSCPTGEEAERLHASSILTWQDMTKSQTTQSWSRLLKQRRLRWLGHVVRMDDGRIPKDFLYGELV